MRPMLVLTLMLDTMVASMMEPRTRNQKPLPLQLMTRITITEVINRI